MKSVEELRQKLVAAAKAVPPSDHVPAAFEKRIMARLAHLSSTRGLLPYLDLWALWTRGLWRAAVSCVTVALMVAAWSLFVPPTPDSEEFTEQDLQLTLMASIQDEEDGW